MKKYAYYSGFKGLDSVLAKISAYKTEFTLIFMVVDNPLLEYRRIHGLICISMKMFLELYRKNVVNGIVLGARKYSPLNYNILEKFKDLEQMGIRADDIYAVPETLEKMPAVLFNEDDKINLVTPRKNFSELFNCNLIVSRGCNLNCKYCQYFAPLSKKNDNISIEEHEQNLLLLKKRFKYVRQLTFIGGEPLLNPDLSTLITKTATIFPYAHLQLVTNGLLLPKLKPDTLKTIALHRCTVVISPYPVTIDILPDIMCTIKTYRLGYRYNYPIGEPCLPLTKFFKNYNFEGKFDKKVMWSNCKVKDTCTTLDRGCIFQCFYPVMAPQAESAFGLSSKVSKSSINLNDESIKSSHDLMTKFYSPADCCSFCNFGTKLELIKWEQAKKPYKQNDFF